MPKSAPVAVAIGVFALADLHAQTPPVQVTLDPVVVIGRRGPERAFDVPASIDSIDGLTIRDGLPAINLSETLVRVPGVFAANRQNYAQDLQISSRGFGARAAFGVRGVRLYQDNIPVTMPDGQGQTGSFSLLSAGRIEVLRGPFSTLYGNASGGVISVYTEDGTPTPVVNLSTSFGSYGTYNVGAKATGIANGLGYVAAFSQFETDGFRDHSSAKRELGNAKLTFDAGPKTRVTIIGSSQYQPQTQDPLGLTDAQWHANPRQADPVATQFDTKKNIRQVQGGAVVDQTLTSDATLRVTGFGGQRSIQQFLALSGVAATSSGGVVDLDRTYGGGGVRLILNRLFNQPLTFNVGADYTKQEEHRQGFVNNNGTIGDKRRDEEDKVSGTDVYGELQWSPIDALAFTVGVRSSRVAYDSVDHYVTAQNPDDSGSRSFTNTSPIASALWHATDNLNFYLSYGRGFETPTFAELAYKPVGTGLNLALNAATSSAYELGMKWLPSAKQRVNVALFTVDTRQEIVTNTSTGGRTTFTNANKTHRRGVEVGWDGELAPGLTAHVNYSYLFAEFSDPYVSGIPPVVNPAGARLPGVPPQQAFGVLNWTPGGFYGFSAGAEIQYTAKIYTNDRNTASAPSYTIGNLRAGFAQTIERVKLGEYVRVNNITDRTYVGSVIVGDTNGRFFEPAPGRNWFAGVSADISF